MLEYTVFKQIIFLFAMARQWCIMYCIYVFVKIEPVKIALKWPGSKVPANSKSPLQKWSETFLPATLSVPFLISIRIYIFLLANNACLSVFPHWRLYFHGLIKRGALVTQSPHDICQLKAFSLERTEFCIAVHAALPLRRSLTLLTYDITEFALWSCTSVKIACRRKSVDNLKNYVKRPLIYYAVDSADIKACISCFFKIWKAVTQIFFLN